MTTQAVPLSAALVDSRPTRELAPRWPLVGTMLVITTAFFVSVHDINVSRAVAYTQTAEEMELSAAGGNPLRRVAFLGVGGWGLVLLATARQKLRVDPLLAAPLVLLFGWTGASFLWSDDPGMCLRRLSVLGCCALAAAGIARSHSLRELCWLVLGTLGALALVGILAELRLGTFRPWAGDYRFAGSVHPNTQGPGLATVSLASLGLIRGSPRGRPWLWAVLGASLVLLLLTKSRTTTAAILFSAGVVLLAQTKLKVQAMTGAAGVFAGGLFLWLLVVAGYDPLTDFRDTLLLGRAEESDTLSGRAFIWPEVLYFVNQRFWLGYGFESFWTPARIEIISDNLGWGLREAHNAYLESLLSGGIIGLVLVLLAAAASLLAAVRGYRSTRDPSYALPLGLVVFGLINGGLESGMVTIEMVPFVLGCCLFRLAFFRDELAPQTGAAT
jgi:O-antigen ligase